MNPAIWYLTIQLASPPIGLAQPLFGPVTEEQCRQVRASIDGLPSVVAAQCRKMVAMFTCGIDGRPGTYTACPIFEGDGFMSVGKQ
jgi:hypothetical protein